MPEYLSKGNIYYNQARKINSSDSVARLGYYMSSSSPPSSSSSSSSPSSSYSAFLTQAIAQTTVNHENRSRLEESDLESSARYLRSKRRRINYPLDVQGSNHSPLESSGFSEGTQIEGTFRETFIKPIHHINLGESNVEAKREFLKLGLGDQLSYEKSKVKRSSSFLGGNQKVVRMKRRNINRRDRRMLIGEYGGDHLVNPYALSELFSQSEIPGFREIFASDSYLRKFCWVVAFLFMTVLSLNDMTVLITEYYEYPITVDVRQRDSARLPFPSVTVCNLNVVRYSALCTSASNSRVDLSSQMPSELRDKLCGLQVEKKNNSGTGGGNGGNGGGSGGGSSGDSELSDINNIGITTSTTSTNTQLNQATATTLTLADSFPTSTAPAPYITSSQSELEFSSGTSTTRRTTSGGGLDLGDFADPALLLSNNHRDSKRARGQRSIRFTEEELENQVHPFAPSKARIRIRNPTPASAGRPDRLAVNRLPSVDKQQVVSSGGIRTPGNPIGGIRPPTSPNSLLPMLLTTSSPPSTTFNTPSYVPPSLPEDFELTERQERELQENLTNWLAVMWNRDPQLTWSLGHQFDDMILRCTMKSINCTHQRSFENSFTPTEGNCFNYKSKVRRVKSTSPGQKLASVQYDEANLAGTNHGLELVLNLEKNEYLSGSSQVGALVMVHHPGDLGYAASEATFVAPEFTTYIGLKMVNITRLPAPYPEYCVDSWPPKFADSLTRNSTYSQQACLRICLQKTIQSHCQCQSAFLPTVELEANNFSGSSNSSSHLQSKNSTTEDQQPQRIIICDTRKLATRQCVRDVMFRAADRVHNCECPPKCQVVRYDKTISTAHWPTREDKVSFDRGKMDVNFQNLAKVIVYFQTMTCEEVSQQAVFNAAKLFSALGGIMGMYVGFSFLSVFEIFEVMSRKTWHHFRMKIERANSQFIRNFRSSN